MINFIFRFFGSDVTFGTISGYKVAECQYHSLEFYCVTDGAEAWIVSKFLINRTADF